MKCKNCDHDLLESAIYCDKCGTLVATTEYFSISCKKFLFLSIVSFGLFSAFWFYFHWKAIKRAENLDIMPFFRTLFSVYFSYNLFKRIFKAAGGKYAKSYIPILFFILYLGLPFVANFIIGNVKSFIISTIPIMVSSIPLVFVQRAANISNLRANPHYELKNKFVISTVVLSAVFAFMVLGEYVISDFMKNMPSFTEERQDYNSGSSVSPLSSSVADLASNMSSEEILKRNNYEANRIKSSLMLPKNINQFATLVDISATLPAIHFSYEVSGKNHIDELTEADSKSLVFPEICKEVPLLLQKRIYSEVVLRIKDTKEEKYFSLETLCK